MAEETQTPAAQAPAAQDVGGGTLRVSPGLAAETPNPTLEEQAAEQAKAAETPEQKVEREAAEAKAKEAEGAGDEGGQEEGDKTPKGVDLKGTVFDGMSEEMQGKIAPYAAAFAENGTLTDAEVSEAAKATGFSEAAVRQFMAGAEAGASDLTAPIYTAFGGEGNFKAFQGWSREAGNLTAAEQRTINKALGVGADGKPDPKLTADPEMAAQLMAAPMERWKAAGGGTEVRDVTREVGAGGGGGNEGDVYASWAQVTKDQGTPEYRNDPAFRAKVEQKLARSPL